MDASEFEPGWNPELPPDAEWCQCELDGEKDVLLSEEDEGPAALL